MKRTIKCPQCQQSALWQDNEFRPFCSERCRLIDLGRWADESYRIPSGPHTHHDDVEEVKTLSEIESSKGQS